MKQQALRFAEDLTLPKVQVIVMRANMSCKHCRQRVSTVISKVNAGLLDYMVDMRKKEVTLRAVVDTNHILKKKKRRKTIMQEDQDPLDHHHTNKKRHPQCFGLFGIMCF